jgi:hypothetical protein
MGDAMRVGANVNLPPPSSDVLIANSGPVHSLAELREEWIKNLDESAVRYFSVPDSLFIHRFEQVAKESWQSAALKMESKGWGTDPRFSDREFAESLLRVLGKLYPGDSVENVLDEAVHFVMEACAALGTVSSDLPGRILSWEEVGKFVAKQPDQNSKWGGKAEVALRFVTLMQTAEGVSWELIDGAPARSNR